MRIVKDTLFCIRILLESAFDTLFLGRTCEEQTQEKPE